MSSLGRLRSYVKGAGHGGHRPELHGGLAPSRSRERLRKRGYACVHMPDVCTYEYICVNMHVCKVHRVLSTQYILNSW